MKPLHSRGFLILVVDNVSQNLQVIGEILEKGGYDTTFASSGQQAIERVQATQPDLILLDLMMSGMNGLEVCQHLKTHPSFCHIPIIFLTPSTEKVDLLQAFRAGADDYITKPLQSEEVIARIEVRLINRSLRKQLETKNQQLQQEEERFQQVFESAAVGMGLVSKAGRFLHVNAAICQILGYSRQELLSLTCQEITHPEDQDTVLKWMQQLLAGETAYYHIEKRYVHKNGSIIWALLNVALVRDRQQQPLYFVAQIQDITTLKKTEIELRHAKEAVVAASQAKSTFLSNMSHELRTPLNAILGFAQLFSRDSSLSSQQQENARIISRSGEHLLNLINKIIDLSKIEAGCMTLDETDFDLTEMLAELKEMFRLKAHSKGLQLKFELASDIPQFIKSDRFKLRQVLINLLSNGMKFTSEGSVTLRVTRGERELNNTPSSGLASQFLCFEVEDTGVGIADDQLVHLFTPFVQVPARIAVEGSGLGLAISRKYVQLLGADINVNSQLGQGTIFQFEIKVTPVVEATTKSQQQGLAIALLPNQPRYRILVVDDDESSRRLLVSILSPLEFEVKEATNGQDALELWENFHPHLVWMDMQMPVLDGYATTQQLKARSEGQATVIIALTASIFEEQKTMILAAGCDDIVCKPIQEQVIFGKVSQHLGVRFLYEESTSVVGTDSDSALDLSALQSLPKLWVTELEQAALALDDELLYALIGQIQSQETALAKALLTYIKNFEYQKIVEAIATARIGDSVQQELSSSAVNSHLPSELKLSCEWVANMKHAIYRADLDIIESLIDHLQGENAPFAHSLQSYLDNFEYKKILTVIAEAEKHLSFAESPL